MEEAEDLEILKFSEVHGTNIQMLRNGFAVKRAGSFCNAIAFTNRPIVPDVPFRIKFNTVAICWSGVLRLGFTTKDPSEINPRSLPRYLCPDLSAKPGFWAKSLDNDVLATDDVLHICVTSQGYAVYNINDTTYAETKVLLEGLPVTEPLWGVFDVYGNCVEIELLQPDPPPGMAAIGDAAISLDGGTLPGSLVDLSEDVAAAAVEPSLLDIALSQLPSNTIPLKFHYNFGTKVTMNSTRSVATRDPHSYHSGQVFLEQPMFYNRKYYFCVMDKIERCLGNLGLGFTNCEPDRLGQLPFDSNDLKDRPEYWTIHQLDDCTRLYTGDIITLILRSNSGAVLLSVNDLHDTNGSPIDASQYKRVMKVTPSNRLWMMLDLFGKMNSIAVLGMSPLTERFTDDGSESLASTSSSSSMSSQVASSCCAPAATAAAAIPKHKDSSPQRSIQSECSICMERPSDAALYDCGHCCLCYGCAKDLMRQSHNCPICRRPIKDVLRIFYG